jgi:hypothetical protein
MTKGVIANKHYYYPSRREEYGKEIWMVSERMQARGFRMNKSQMVLRELSGDPVRAIAFLKKVNWLIAFHQYNRFLIIASYLLGITTALFVYVWFIK